MATVESFRNKPFDILEKMRNDAMMRQQLQYQAIARQYNQQKNALDLAQAQQKLQQDLQNYEQGYNGNTPSAIQEYNFLSKLSPREQALYLRAKAPNSQIQFENMGMMDGMGDVGDMNQPMTMPAPQRQPSALSQRQPALPTQRKPVGQGRMPQGAPLPPQGPSMPTQGASQPQPQLSDLPDPPVDLGDGTAEYKGRRLDKKIAEKLFLSDSKNPTIAGEERQGSYLLQQASLGYENLLKSLYNKPGERSGAERPNAAEALLGLKLSPISPRIARSAKREQFVQATETIADALLKAATGAGQNQDEARRKIEEITPSWFDDDDTIKQKLNAIPAYIEAIKARAGRATPKGFTIPTEEGLRLNAGQQPTQNAAQPMMPAAGNVIQTIHGLVTVTK
jgi:hypothetical protein